MRAWIPHVMAICFTAMPAEARDITIRSGEHEGFTRLVFYIAAADTYHISNTHDGYLLALPSGVTGFDLSRAFDLIKRSRIRALTPTSNGKLTIQQGCDCHFKDFRLPTGELVVDIVDGPNPNSRPSVVAVASSLPRPISANRQRESLPLFSTTVEQNELADTQVKPSADPTLETHSQSGEIPQVNKQELLTQLSRAASQGLIDANLTRPETSPVSVPSDTEAPASEPPPVPHSPEQHVRMQTAVEYARANQSSAIHPTDTSHACLPDQQFDIAQWGVYLPETNAPVFEASNYLGEFDRPDRDRLVSHIRQNIYMTFGLEALQLMENYDDNLGDGTVLRMMAEVVEYGEAKSHAYWASQLTCNTRGALWAVLSQPTLQDHVNTNAVIRSFSELPPHLRTHLSPILARKFLNSGHVDAAVEIRNMAMRTGRTPSGEQTILEAKLNLAKGNTDKAEQELTDTIQTALTQTQPAISALIESKLQNDRGISDKELSLLASVAVEHKGSKEGANLQRLHIRALFHMGRFASAFELLDKSSIGTDRGDLLNDAGGYLVLLGSDAEFLTYSLTRSDWGSISAAVRLKMAERLSDLGFHEYARRHVLSDIDTPDRNAREFLAKMALMQNKPKVALGYLAGLDSKTAISLREEAIRRGVTTGGALPLEEIPKGTPDIWRSLETLEHPIPVTVQKVLASKTPTPAGGPKADLKTYQGILDRSNETRAALAELLGIIPSIDGSR